MATSIEELEVRLKNNKEYLEKIQNDIKLIEEELVLLKSASSIGSATGADIKPVQAHDKVNPLNEKETQSLDGFYRPELSNTKMPQNSNYINPYQQPGQRNQYQPQGQGNQYQPQVQGAQYQQPGQGNQYQPQVQGAQYQPQVQGAQYQQPGQGNQYQPQGQGSIYRSQQSFSNPQATSVQKNIPQYSAEKQSKVYREISFQENAEAVLGKNIMGIAASVLIFISFILFAMLLIPSLTDGMKMGLMFFVSISVTAIGLFKWFKNKESIFFISLGACGVGSIYISIFLCAAYFHVINEIVLYVLLLAWAAGVLFLSKYKQRLFEIIGNAGILVSVLFGVYRCIDQSDSGMLVFLCIYFIIGSLAFMLLRIKDDITYSISGIAIFISSIAFECAIDKLEYVAVFSSQETALIIISILIGIICLGMITFGLIKYRNNQNVFAVILSILYNVLLLCLINIIFDSKSADYGSYIMCILIFAAIEFYKRKIYKPDSDQNVLFYVWQGMLTFTAIIYTFRIDIFKDYTGAILLMIPLAIYGFIVDDTFSKYTSVVLYAIVCFGATVTEELYVVYVITGFAVFLVMMFIKKGQYNVIIKCASYILFLIGITISTLMLGQEYQWNMDMYAAVYIIVMGVINLAAKITAFSKNWLTLDDENSTGIMTAVVNGLLMLFSLLAMNEIHSDHYFAHFLAVLGAIGLFMVNSFEQMEKRKSGLSVYVGIKFTVLVTCILTSYDAPNYVLSITTFILSIIFIVIGFKLDTKSLRLYGLIISMICVFKLVMIDITYDNTAGHALSFFISGVLCFVISALYNIADKKLNAGNVDKPHESNSAGLYGNNSAGLYGSGQQNIPVKEDLNSMYNQYDLPNTPSEMNDMYKY